MGVYFLGSGALGLPVLEKLLNAPGAKILGVGTQPDRAAGRNRHLQPTPVGRFADAHLPGGVRRIANVNDPGFLSELAALAPDVVLVAAFGQLLKAELLALPRHGCLNIHASLLPRHRGASPVNTAIMAGDTVTGISFMRMDAGLDTGPVYCHLHEAVRADDTVPELERRLGLLAASGIEDCLTAVARCGLQPVKQPVEGVTNAPKLRKTDGIADWQQPAVVLERRCRGLQPWPRLGFSLPTPKGPRQIQIIRATLAEVPVNRTLAPGEFMVTPPDTWLVGCGAGALNLERIIPEGCGEMAVGDFLHGAHFLTCGKQT